MEKIYKLPLQITQKTYTPPLQTQNHMFTTHAHCTWALTQGKTKEHAIPIPTPRAERGPRPPFGLLCSPPFLPGSPFYLKSQAMRCEERRREERVKRKEAKEKRLSHASSDNEFSWFSSAAASPPGPVGYYSECGFCSEF